MLSFDATSFVQTLEDLQQDALALGNILQDSSFIADLEVLVANNFDRVWGTQGANIASDWNGNSLVKTGNLKLSLTSPGALRLEIIGDTVTISSDVYYDRYVNDLYRFYGVDDTFDSQLSRLIEQYLVREGKLNWQ